MTDQRTDTLAAGVLLLRTGDDVAVATRALEPGDEIAPDGRAVAVTTVVPRSHKVALRDLPAGAPVHKYGQVIGVTTEPVPAGAHVHSHNLVFEDGERAHELGGTHTELEVPAGPRPTFRGYRRADGRVGTRNYVAILTSVNCSASTAKMIAAQFPDSALEAFPNVGGVTLLSVLRQLRDGHRSRPKDFPWSLALVGLRDVRDYKITSNGGDAAPRPHSASPFNIKVRSLTMESFTAAEVRSLYAPPTPSPV